MNDPHHRDSTQQGWITCHVSTKNGFKLAAKFQSGKIRRNMKNFQEKGKEFQYNK